MSEHVRVVSALEARNRLLHVHCTGYSCTEYCAEQGMRVTGCRAAPSCHRIGTKEHAYRLHRKHPLPGVSRYTLATHQALQLW